MLAQDTNISSIAQDQTSLRAVEQLTRVLGRIGDILADPTVTDVNVNPDGLIWVSRYNGKRTEGNLSRKQREQIIAVVASTMRQEATVTTPIVEGVLLTDGSRFEGILPTVNDEPSFSIRKRPAMVYPLAHYVSHGLMTERQCRAIETAIVAPRNIIISGGTGSGKTTLLNAIVEGIYRLTPEVRCVIIEDTCELQVAGGVDVVRLRTTPTVNQAALLRAALRSFPDRILVGEVRGGEALDMLTAWNTGHEGGACSIHSNTSDPHAALTRLETMIQQVVVTPQQRIIAEAVQLIVCVERVSLAGRTVRRVKQIARVEGWDAQAERYRLKIED